MARHDSTKSFVRQVLNVPLARYFADRGRFGDLDFEAWARRSPPGPSCPRGSASCRLHAG